MTTASVLFEEITGKEGNVGLITLNRPEVLNSLNHTMIQAMHTHLKEWANAADIKAVIIQATDGRAFCAGGDLRATYDKFKAHDLVLTNFFRDEYQLNRCIFHYPKPYIAMLDGITMGGGVGISIHGSHRIATERLLFAMPETGIGFFPDVGGTYFLPRIIKHIGFYLGLTGARLSSDDCVALGIATQKISRDNLKKVFDAILHTPLGSDARKSVSDIINAHALTMASSSLLEQQTEIDYCFAAQTIEQLVQSLQESSSAICREALVTLAKKSPTSLKITLRALLEGKNFSFDDCMRQEFRLVTHFLKEHDFAEGIRAVIIDKDQSPNWQPSTLDAVTQEDVEKYFVPLTEELI